MCWELFANVTVEQLEDRTGVAGGSSDLVDQGQDGPAQVRAGVGPAAKIEDASATGLVPAMGLITV